MEYYRMCAHSEGLPTANRCSESPEYYIKNVRTSDNDFMHFSCIKHKLAPSGECIYIDF